MKNDHKQKGKRIRSARTLLAFLHPLGSKPAELERPLQRTVPLILVVLSMLASYLHFNQSAYITKYNWKQTSDNGTIGGGIICFGENSAYSYRWPIITKEKQYKGIVILCVGYENGSLFAGR